MFRSPASSPRSLVPPSSFPSGLQPNASRGDRNGNRADTNMRRSSRNDMSFEQVLEAGETMVIKEGIDFDSLGEDSAPSLKYLSSFPSSPLSPPSSSSSRPQSMLSPRAKNSNSLASPTPRPPASISASTSASSSSNDLFYDAEDPDYQTKRRSMYRSQGTASSPDLATLVRKAKQRASILPASNNKDKRREAPPLPTSPNPHPPPNPAPRHRHRSSTSSSGHTMPATTPTTVQKGRLQKPGPSTGPSSGAERVPSTSSVHDDGCVKNSKSSVRQKTSAFIGRMLNPTRERSKTDASAPPKRMARTTPPVPPLPASPTADASPMSPRIAPILTAPDMSKPLPPLQTKATASGLSPRPPSPRKTVPTLDATTSVRAVGHGKRRSMSVGEVDHMKTPSSSLTPAIPPPSAREKRSEELVGWDSTMRGILSEFKGELSQFDQGTAASTNMLGLRVPPGSSQQHARPRIQKPDPNSSVSTRPDIRVATSSPPPTIKPNPTIVAYAPDADETGVRRGSVDTPDAIALRSPQLLAGATIRASSYSQRPYPSAGTRPLGPRSASSMHPSSEARGRLLAHPRPTAFNSEPSLVPASANGVTSPLSALSQQDLSTSSSQQFRQLISKSGSIDPEELEARGKECAKRVWEEDEEFLVKERIAEWLGGVGRVNKYALRHYMDNFDFSGLRLDLAFRRLCAKLYLKAETQQVDRILEEFSRRYWDCNPGSLFGNPGVVHAVAYSLLLLNTDLHVADLTNRMSRGQFVRNTLFTIQMQLRPNRSAQGSSSDLVNSERDGDSVREPGNEGNDVDASTVRSQAKRSDSITSWNSISRDAALANLFVGSPAVGSSAPLPNDSTASVPASMTSAAEAKTPSTLVSSVVYDRNWESDMESLLKDMYNAVKSQQVLQPLNARTSISSLTPNTPLMRNRSLRVQQDRLTTLKRGSIRGIQSILGAQNGMSPYSSNSSVDGRASPAPSFATSAHENLQGSTMSFMTPALGFASNLSYTIIRETQEDDDRSEGSEDSADTTISITDEELALLGPPWAKEGMLCRKQYNETAGKRAKSKAWMDVFVVIQKGELNMFTFGNHAVDNQRAVGGGNWLETANHVGSLQLSHSLSHALPPPGYNRQRPFCMVLTLASGAVYFFQAGTEELVNEWVQTCNYWAARQSKEPLAGGVSNMEYGWNRVSDVLQPGRAASDDESVRIRDFTDNASVRSARSNHSRFSRKDVAATMRIGSPRSDRTNITEWKSPLAPSVASMHDEETQLEALKKHVASLTQELQEHNELRGPMMALYPSRSQSAAKALSNWERKSQYLLAEHVKYELYVDSLQAAMTLRFKKRGEKALEHALRSDAAQGSSKTKSNERTIPKTIIESDERSPSVVGSPPASTVRHRREFAQADTESDT